MPSATSSSSARADGVCVVMRRERRRRIESVACSLKRRKRYRVTARDRIRASQPVSAIDADPRDVAFEERVRRLRRRVRDERDAATASTPGAGERSRESR